MLLTQRGGTLREIAQLCINNDKGVIQNEQETEHRMCASDYSGRATPEAFV